LMGASVPSPYRSDPARIIIADDHALVRDGLRLMLDGVPDILIVGEAASGQETVDLAHRLQPDLILLDLRMPGLDGIGVTRIIKQSRPAVQVLFLTMFENPDTRSAAREAGASGYLCKDVSMSELVTAIHQVLQGKVLFD
ncbi:response regulator, partial [Nitrolancea hollandica]